MAEFLDSPVEPLTLSLCGTAAREQDVAFEHVPL